MPTDAAISVGTKENPQDQRPHRPASIPEGGEPR
jgi:hypothetical protein